MAASIAPTWPKAIAGIALSTSAIVMCFISFISLFSP